MLPTFIAMMVIIVVIVLWAISTQRRLVVLDENTKDAMNQIGMQLSSRIDALTALLNLIRNCAQQESEILMEIVKSRRNMITAKSKPYDVLYQEEMIAEVLGRIAIIEEQYLELKGNLNYSKTKDAQEIFENMVRTSRLIYNDSVSKLNREIRMIPVLIIARVLGFRQKEYLEEHVIRANIAVVCK